MCKFLFIGMQIKIILMYNNNNVYLLLLCFEGYGWIVYNELNDVLKPTPFAIELSTMLNQCQKKNKNIFISGCRDVLFSKKHPYFTFY